MATQASIAAPPSNSPVYSGGTIVGYKQGGAPGVVQTADPNAKTPATTSGSSYTPNGASATTTPTVVTDANIRENAIPNIQQGAATALSSPKVTNATTPVTPVSTTTPAPTVTPGPGSTTPQSTTQAPAPGSSTPTSATTPDTSTDSSDNEYDSFLKSMFDSNPSTATQGVSPANDPYISMLEQMRQTSDAASSQLIAATQAQFESRKATLAATQQAQQAGMMQELVSNGEAKYAPLLAGSALTSDEQSHILALNSIDAEESTSLATLQKAQDDEDFQTMGKELDHLDSLRTDKINAASKLSDAATAATNALNTAKAAVTTQINSVAEDLAKNGAPADVLTAAGSAATVADAITAGNGYFQDPTSDGAQYQAYVKATQAKGLTPMAAGDFLAKQKSDQAYSTAYGSEAGKTAADAAAGLNPDGSSSATAPDAGATGITGATGLSLTAFNYLTQGTGALTRLPAAQRTAFMNEANEFLNKNGLDYATFQSEYKGATQVVQNNVERENNVNTFGGEVAGTVDSLISDINGDASSAEAVPGEESRTGMSSLRIANVLDLMAGNATNNAFAEKYSTQLGFLANDLAGYLSASRGASSPDDSDKRDAASMIANGMNSGSLSAFKDSISSNMAKTAAVVTAQKQASQKQVWDLFGVGSQYKAPAPQITDEQAKTNVDSYVKSNPDKANSTASLYELPGWTDQDVWEYINQVQSSTTPSQ